MSWHYLYAHKTATTASRDGLLHVRIVLRAITYTMLSNVVLHAYENSRILIYTSKYVQKLYL